MNESLMKFQVYFTCKAYFVGKNVSADFVRCSTDKLYYFIYIYIKLLKFSNSWLFIVLYILIYIFLKKIINYILNRLVIYVNFFKLKLLIYIYI